MCVNAGASSCLLDKDTVAVLEHEKAFRCDSLHHKHVRPIYTETIVEQCLLDRGPGHVAFKQRFAVAIDDHDFIERVVHGP